MVRNIKAYMSRVWIGSNDGGKDTCITKIVFLSAGPMLDPPSKIINVIS